MRFSGDPLTRFLYKSHTVLFGGPRVFYTQHPLRVYVPEYTIDLAAFEGLNNATLGHTVSPAFDLTVHVENRRFFEAWCHNQGEVVISYSGVALAWGRVPGFCLRRRSAANFTVVTWGQKVYLSDDLRKRLTREWHTGTAKVDVDMKLHYYPNCPFLPMMSRSGTLSIWHELMLGDTREIEINVL
uniref:Late embryogenesis abundant protein LEA-2 subgroup domain-containing protein n=1 Tax=Setaria italica TaxID=4555 RepID=K3XQW3_SETIT